MSTGRRPVPVPAPLLTGRKGFLYPELQSVLSIYFLLSPRAILASAHCCPVYSLQDGFHGLERRRVQQTPHYICISAVDIADRHREADLHSSPYMALAANTRQILPLKYGYMKETLGWIRQTL